MPVQKTNGNQHVAPSHTEYVEYQGEQQRLSSIANRSINVDDLKGMTYTTYVRHQLPPKLTDRALLHTANHYLMQCTQSGYPFVTYEDALIHTIVPELMQRLEEKNEEIKQLQQSHTH